MKRLNQIEAVLQGGLFEVYHHKDYGASPVRILGDNSKVTSYGTWLSPALGVQAFLVDAGLSEVQALTVLRALAEGSDTRLTFDLSN